MIPENPVTVTIPAEAADTDRLFPKLIVPAVPTVLSLSLTTTPEPDAVIPVNPEPSPTKLDAVTIPAAILPLAKIVAAVPTLRPPVAVVTPVTVSYTHLTLPPSDLV